jgi:hypothetical protein
MRRPVTAVVVALRAAALGALALLAWNPAAPPPRPGAGGAPPLVLLDASLSMAGHGGQWRAALDTARALARGGPIWRFGARVAAFDTLAPGDGDSRLAPALAAAAARGEPVAVVTDGAITDVGDIAPDLLRRARIVVLPRAPFFDGFVAAVDGPRRVAAADTVRLRVSYGTAGGRPPARRAALVVSGAGRRLAAQRVTLPDSGTATAELRFPAARLPPGWSALTVRLDGPGDAEPRDDARLFVLAVSPRPAVVMLAAPPDWDTRFLARTLAEVAGLPVRTFVVAELGDARWRDGATLAPVDAGAVAAAVEHADLVVEAGAPMAWRRFRPGRAVLALPRGERAGEWYVEPPGPSPLAAGLAGIAWDSLPPATVLADIPGDSAGLAVLTARLGRRGPPRPVVWVASSAGARRAVIAAGGLYRWAFRGGASGVAYRALVAGLVDWLLGEPEAGRDVVTPVVPEVANGLPLEWRWQGRGEPRAVALRLTRAGGGGGGGGAGQERRETLRFDAAGRAALWLPPGIYRYAAGEGTEGAARGVVAVEEYSDEWRWARPVLAPQAGVAAGRARAVRLRERWWLFAAAVAALAAEWAWRRRAGMP